MCNLQKFVNLLILALVNGRYGKTVKPTESYNHFLDMIHDDNGRTCLVKKVIFRLERYIHVIYVVAESSPPTAD